MLRQFADSILSYLSRMFPADRGYAKADFDRAPMPEAIRRYLSQSLLTRVEVELAPLRNLRSTWLDSEHPDVRTAVADLDARLVEHARVPSEEWPSTLERAVRNAISYHARPARTLLDFLFARADEVYTLPGIERKLAFFMPYPRLLDELRHYVEENEIEEIGRQAIASVLGGIDRDFAERYDVASWLQLFRPMFEIASVLPEYENEVPVALAVAFFRDKGVEAVEIALERIHEINGVETVNPTRLQSVLAGARDGMESWTREGGQSESAAATSPVQVPGREEAPAPSPPAHAAATAWEQEAPPVRERAPSPSPAEAASVTSRTEAPPAAASAPGESVPIWKQFQPGQVHPAPGQTTRKADAGHAAEKQPAEAAGGERKPLWMRYAHVSPRAPATFQENAVRGSELARLEEAVLGEAARDRTFYLRHLFGGSREDYEAVLFRLSRAADWNEASRIIAGDVFRRNRVDIYSDAAVSFTNAVESRFDEA